MSRILSFAYGLVCYVVFFATFLYAIGFVAGVGVPKGIDSGAAGPLLPSLAVNAALLTLFAVQHSVMARPAFKAWWTRFVSPTIERSTFVLAASLALLLLFWQWRPLPAPVWTVEDGVLRGLLWGLSALGWLMVLLGTFMISHAQLFGVSQVWARVRGRTEPEPVFQTRGFYRYIRHPLMLGFLIAFWATPAMTVGHLVFALACTGFILIATLGLEERDLERALGEQYREYRRQVPAFLPRFGRRAAEGEARQVARQVP